MRFGHLLGTSAIVDRVVVQDPQLESVNLAKPAGRCLAPQLQLPHDLFSPQLQLFALVDVAQGMDLKGVLRPSTAIKARARTAALRGLLQVPRHGRVLRAIQRGVVEHAAAAAGGPHGLVLAPGEDEGAHVPAQAQARHRQAMKGIENYPKSLETARKSANPSNI